MPPLSNLKYSLLLLAFFTPDVNRQVRNGARLPGSSSLNNKRLLAIVDEITILNMELLKREADL